MGDSWARAGMTKHVLAGSSALCYPANAASKCPSCQILCAFQQEPSRRMRMFRRSRTKRARIHRFFKNENFPALISFLVQNSFVCGSHWFHLHHHADTGGMFGGSRAPSVGVLARADSVAGARSGGGGPGGMNRPGTAKLGEARRSAPIVLSHHISSEL